MKKRIVLFFIMLMVCSLIFTSCSDGNADDSGDSLNIVCTIFPEYDWVREIVGDISNVDITLLLENGVDLHSYQATANDIIKIVGCDMFIYVGGESDEWVHDVLEQKTNENMVVINLLDVLSDSLKEEEFVEGMEDDHEHDEDEQDDREHDEVCYDEHVWLSLRNAEKLCDHIADKLAEIDPENSEAYSANCDAYKAEMSVLDSEYESVISESEKNVLLFSDRFPFRYMTEDYGLDYYAAFSGCSAETEASFETVTFLSEKVDELGLDCVITIDGTKHDLAQTVISNTSSKDQTELVLDSMQGITMTDVEDGATYLSIMRSNLDVLRDALN